jgi:hypothetical protein
MSQRDATAEELALARKIAINAVRALISKEKDNGI